MRPSCPVGAPHLVRCFNLRRSQYSAVGRRLLIVATEFDIVAIGREALAADAASALSLCGLVRPRHLRALCLISAAGANSLRHPPCPACASLTTRQSDLMCMRIRRIHPALVELQLMLSNHTIADCSSRDFSSSLRNSPTSACTTRAVTGAIAAQQVRTTPRPGEPPSF